MHKPFKLIQLSDPHLISDPNGLVRGFNTYSFLQAVVLHIRKYHTDADAVILTGDLSQDGSTESYLHLETLISDLGFPTYALPGNHDNCETMRASLTNGIIKLHKDIAFGKWRCLLLNTVVPKQVFGELSDNELGWLHSALQTDKDTPTLITLHHPPVSVDSAWMDRIGLLNADKLMALIQEAPQVNLVLYGHVHQIHFVQSAHTDFLSCPSTWRQFKPYATEFAVDVLPPAYRVLHLSSGGNYKTHVEFVSIKNALNKK